MFAFFYGGRRFITIMHFKVSFSGSTFLLNRSLKFLSRNFIKFPLLGGIVLAINNYIHIYIHIYTNTCIHTVYMLLKLIEAETQLTDTGPVTPSEPQDKDNGYFKKNCPAQ